MKKILLLLPFFLWTCGGVDSSSNAPTEPEDPGNDAETVYFDNVGMVGEGDYLNCCLGQIQLSWSSAPNNEDITHFTIEQILNDIPQTIATINYSSNAINYNFFDGPLSSVNVITSTYNLIVHNKNGTAASSNGQGFYYTKMNGGINWERSYGQTNSGQTKVVDAIPYGDYMIIGFDNGSPGLMLISQDGENSTQLNFDVSGGANSISSDGGPIIIGSYAKIIKVDTGGNIIWSKSGDEITNGHGGAMRNIYDVLDDESSSGFHYYSGEIGSSSSSFGVGKIDGDGNPIWFKNFGASSSGVGGGTPAAYSLAKIDNNNFVAAGRVLKYEGGNNIPKGYIVSFTSDGTVTNEKWFDNIVGIRDIKVLSDNSFLIVGGEGIAKVSQQGSIIFEINGIEDESKAGQELIELHSALELNDGSILVAGEGYTNGQRQRYGFRMDRKDIYLMLLDPNGNLIRDFILYHKGGFDQNQNFNQSFNARLFMGNDNTVKLACTRDFNSTSDKEIFVYSLNF